MKTETKAEVMEEVKTVKKVAIDPAQWEVIVKYLYETTVPFGGGKKMIVVEEAIASAILVDLTLNENG